MPKKRRSRAFWKNFKFKYKLTVVNENTLEEIVGLRVSKLNGLSVLLSVLAVLFLIAACIIAFTPLRNYLPGYMNSEVRTQIVDNALRVDSLQQILNKQNLYIMNIQDIFSGKVAIDSVQTLDSLTAAREDTLMERTKREEEFRRQYEENEKYNLTTVTSQPDVNGLILYRPTRGMVLFPGAVGVKMGIQPALVKGLQPAVQGEILLPGIQLGPLAPGGLQDLPHAPVPPGQDGLQEAGV